MLRQPTLRRFRTLALAAGPVITILLLGQHLKKDKFIGTAVIYIFMVNTVKLVPYAWLNLFDTANAFNTFYEHCWVLKEPDEAVRTSRLLLCDLTARVLRQGLSLLGIRACEMM